MIIVIHLLSCSLSYMAPWVFWEAVRRFVGMRNFSPQWACLVDYWIIWSRKDSSGETTFAEKETGTDVTFFLPMSFPSTAYTRWRTCWNQNWRGKNVWEVDFQSSEIWGCRNWRSQLRKGRLQTTPDWRGLSTKAYTWVVDIVILQNGKEKS